MRGLVGLFHKTNNELDNHGGQVIMRLVWRRLRGLQWVSHKIIRFLG
jgi:hypothetical protein